MPVTCHFLAFVVLCYWHGIGPGARSCCGSIASVLVMASSQSWRPLLCSKGVARQPTSIRSLRIGATESPIRPDWGLSETMGEWRCLSVRGRDGKVHFHRVQDLLDLMGWAPRAGCGYGWNMTLIMPSMTRTICEP